MEEWKDGGRNGTLYLNTIHDNDNQERYPRTPIQGIVGENDMNALPNLIPRRSKGHHNQCPEEDQMPKKNRATLLTIPSVLLYRVPSHGLRLVFSLAAAIPE